MLIGFHHSTWLSSSTTFYSIGSKCFFFFKDYFHESRAKLKWIKVGLNPLKPFIQLKWPFKRFGSFWKTKVTGREKDFVEEIEDYLHENLFEIFSWKWNACRRFWCTIETRSGAIESVWKGPNKSCELSSIWFSISFKFGSIFFLLPQSLNNGRCYSIFIVGRLCTLLLSSYSVSVGFAHFNAFLFVGELAAILGRCSSAQHFHLSQRRIDWLTPDADGIFDELLCNSTDYLRELICNRCFVIINQCSHIVENRCNSWQFSFFNSIYFLFALALSVLIKSNQTR